jgi:hypothetical protein
MGAMDGVATMNAVRDIPFVCFPSSFQYETGIAISRKYLFAHPEEWTYTGFNIVLRALIEAHPCK